MFKTHPKEPTPETTSIIQRANDAMMRGQTIDDYDLPQSVKQRIRERRYSAIEINAAYAKVKNPHLYQT